jgi:biopolymer transport protein ExbD
MTEVNLRVTQAGENVEYYVDGEKVSFEAVGNKVLEAQGDGFAYVNIVGDPQVKSGKIQEVKNELRKVDLRRVLYVCGTDVAVQRKLEPYGAVKELSDFSEESMDGDVQIRLNKDDKLWYIKVVKVGKSGVSAISQKDLFAMAKKDVEQNNGISFYLIVDDDSSYGAYSSAVQSVYDAFVTVREDLAMQSYGKAFSDLEEDQQDELRQRCTVKIIEINK